MKEYKIEMKFASWFEVEWIHPFYPHDTFARQIHDSYEHAAEAVEMLKKVWAEHSHGLEQPSEYRILCRTVSEWEPV